MVWQRGTGFEHNQGLGGAEMFFDTLKLKQYTSGWYPLFPMHSLGSDSNDSPWPLVDVTIETMLKILLENISYFKISREKIQPNKISNQAQ